MIVELKRASAWVGHKPDELAYSLKPIEDEDDFLNEWLADIPSFEWAFDKWGDIIITKSDIEGIKYCVTIYDDYVE